MPKADLLATIDQQTPMRSGEFVTVGAVVQVTQLAMTSPFSGDFQIKDSGRLIVGEETSSGGRVLLAQEGLFGYDEDSVQAFALFARTVPSGYTAGDFLAGKVSGNFLLYDNSEGTLGVYSPAGAGFIAGSDGSLYAGDTDGAHMHWSSADHAFQVRNGEDVKISLDANGDGFFDGTVYAQGGRIYGQMAVDGLLRVGDVDGPQVAMGKFSRINDDGDLVETGEIMATDANNLPWFHVTAGGETAGAGYFHLGATGDYAGRMTFDGETLSVASWIVDSNAFVSPSGYIELDTVDGIKFISPPEGSVGEGLGDSVYEDHMISVWENADDELPVHRISAWKSLDTPAVHTLFLQAEPPPGQRARILHSALSDSQAQFVLRAVGGYDTVNQQAPTITITAYNAEGGGVYTHSRIDLDADVVRIWAYEEASAPGGTVANGSMTYTDGTWDPGVGAGLYMYMSAEWQPIVLDADAVERKTADFTADGTATYFIDCTGGNVTCTLPSAANVPLGWTYTFKRQDSSGNTIYVDPGTDSIDGSTTDRQLTTQHDYLVIRKRNNTNWIIIGSS